MWRNAYVGGCYVGECLCGKMLMWENAYLGECYVGECCAVLQRAVISRKHVELKVCVWRWGLHHCCKVLEIKY